MVYQYAYIRICVSFGIIIGKRNYALCISSLQAVWTSACLNLVMICLSVLFSDTAYNQSKNIHFALCCNVCYDYGME